MLKRGGAVFNFRRARHSFAFPVHAAADKSLIAGTPMKRDFSLILVSWSELGSSMAGRANALWTGRRRRSTTVAGASDVPRHTDKRRLAAGSGQMQESGCARMGESYPHSCRSCPFRLGAAAARHQHTMMSKETVDAGVSADRCFIDDADQLRKRMRTYMQVRRIWTNSPGGQVGGKSCTHRTKPDSRGTRRRSKIKWPQSLRGRHPVRRHSFLDESRRLRQTARD